MKNYFPFIFHFILFSACINDHSRLTEFERKRSDSLKLANDEKQSFINDMVLMFKEVEKDLDSIAGRQKNIFLYTQNPGDVKKFLEEINLDVAFINGIITKNRNQINNINKKLKESRDENAELKSSIEKLNTRLADKENELTEMKEKLAKYDTHIDNLYYTLGILELDNAVLEETVAEETEMLHTSYYVVGSSRELQKDSVIDKKGGLLGLGMITKMKNNYNNRVFTRINNMETNVIPVNSKDINIVTSHPAGTYIFDKERGEIKNIIITDPEKFWEASKFLVVVKN